MTQDVKVCLVNASLKRSLFPPLSLASLSSFLRENERDVTVLDLSTSEPFLKDAFLLEMIERSFCLNRRLDMTSPAASKKREKLLDLFRLWKECLLAEAPDVVGFTVDHSNLSPSLFLAQLLKAENPRLMTIFGGPECSLDEVMKVVSSTGVVDLAVRGEGEVTLLEVVKTLEQGELLNPPTGTVLFRNGTMMKNSPRPAIADLNTLPFPDFSDFQLDRYTERMLPVSLSRGCVGNCVFCNERIFWERKIRYRRPESVVKEIERDREYGITTFRFNDSLLNGNIPLLKNLCRLLIERGLDIRWYGNARPEKLSVDMLELMKKAGCFELRYGLESPVPRILNEMNKRTTLEEVTTVLKNTVRVGIPLRINVVCAFPTETKQDFINSLRWLYENRDLFDTAMVNRFVLASASDIFQTPQIYDMTYESLYDGTDISKAGTYSWRSAQVHGDTMQFRYVVCSLLIQNLGKLAGTPHVQARDQGGLSHYITEEIQKFRGSDSCESVYDRLYDSYRRELPS
ncbi:MAG: radical SAM protein [Theionarchaea archaeon]|nr:radical SAM protein [Theionarchaea archaeon]MBU7038814.1 radical SAM protein [Theionarchaea archaeon]